MRMIGGAFICALAFQGPCLAQDVNGDWARGDGQARVRIEPCGASLCAVNTWIKDSTGGEKVGDRLILSLKAEGSSKWTGEARDPQRHLTYNIDIEVPSAEAMTTRGCFIGRLLCKQVSWTRIN